MRKIKNPWLHKDHYDCFGCCPDNPIGIKMEFYEDGDDIVSFWKPSTHYQGWIDTLHGGIQSTLLDEICGWVVFRKLQTSGVTSKLEVRYHKPIMTTEWLISWPQYIMKKVRFALKQTPPISLFLKIKPVKWASLRVSWRMSKYCFSQLRELIHLC